MIDERKKLRERKITKKAKVIASICAIFIILAVAKGVQLAIKSGNAAWVAHEYVMSPKSFAPNGDGQVKKWQGDIAFNPNTGIENTNDNGLVQPGSGYTTTPTPTTPTEHRAPRDSNGLGVDSTYYYSGDFPAYSNYNFESPLSHHFDVYAPKLVDQNALQGLAFDPNDGNTGLFVYGLPFNPNGITNSSLVDPLDGGEASAIRVPYKRPIETTNENRTPLLETNQALNDSAEPIISHTTRSAQNGNLNISAVDQGDVHMLNMRAKTKYSNTLYDNKDSVMFTYTTVVDGSSFHLDSVYLNTMNYGAITGSIEIEYSSALTMTDLLTDAITELKGAGTAAAPTTAGAGLAKSAIDSLRIDTGTKADSAVTVTTANGKKITKIFISEVKAGMRANYSHRDSVRDDFEGYYPKATEIFGGVRDSSTSDTNSLYSLLRTDANGDIQTTIQKNRSDVLIERFLKNIKFTGAGNPTGEIKITLHQNNGYEKAYRDYKGLEHFYRRIQVKDSEGPSKNPSGAADELPPNYTHDRNYKIKIADAYNEARHMRSRGLPGYMATDAGDIGEHLVIGGLALKVNNGITEVDAHTTYTNGNGMGGTFMNPSAYQHSGDNGRFRNVWWTGGTRLYYHDADQVAAMQPGRDSDPYDIKYMDDSGNVLGTPLGKGQTTSIPAGDSSEEGRATKIGGNLILNDPDKLLYVNSSEQSIDSLHYRFQYTDTGAGKSKQYYQTSLNPVDPTSNSSEAIRTAISQNSNYYWFNGPEAGTLINNRGVVKGHQYWGADEPNNQVVTNELIGSEAWINIWGGVLRGVRNNVYDSLIYPGLASSATGVLPTGAVTEQQLAGLVSWSDGSMGKKDVGSGYLIEYSPYDADHNGDSGDNDSLRTMLDEIHITQEIGSSSDAYITSYSDVLRDEALSNIKGGFYTLSTSADSLFVAPDSPGVKNDATGENTKIPLIMKKVYAPQMDYKDPDWEPTGPTAPGFIPDEAGNLWYKDATHTTWEDMNLKAGANLLYDINKNEFYNRDKTAVYKKRADVPDADSLRLKENNLVLLVQTNIPVTAPSELIEDQIWYDGTDYKGETVYDASHNPVPYKDTNGTAVTGLISNDDLADMGLSLPYGRNIEYRGLTSATGYNPTDAGEKEMLDLKFSASAIAQKFPKNGDKTKIADNIYVHSFVSDREGNWTETMEPANSLKTSFVSQYKYKKWITVGELGGTNNYDTEGEELPSDLVRQSLPSLLLLNDASKETVVNGIGIDSLLAKGPDNQGTIDKYIHIEDPTGYWAPGATSGYRTYELVRYDISDNDNSNMPEAGNLPPGAKKALKVDSSNAFPNLVATRIPTNVYSEATGDSFDSDYTSVYGFNPIYNVKIGQDNDWGDPAYPNYWFNYNAVADNKLTTFYYRDVTQPQLIDEKVPEAKVTPLDITIKFTNKYGRNVKIQKADGSYEVAALKLHDSAIKSNDTASQNVTMAQLTAVYGSPVPGALDSIYQQIQGNKYEKPDSTFADLAAKLKTAEDVNGYKAFSADATGEWWSTLAGTGTGSGFSVPAGANQLTIDIQLDGKVSLEASPLLRFEPKYVMNPEQQAQALDTIILTVTDYKTPPNGDRSVVGDYAVTAKVYGLHNSDMYGSTVVKPSENDLTLSQSILLKDLDAESEATQWKPIGITWPSFDNWVEFDDGGYVRKYEIPAKRLKMMLNGVKSDPLINTPGLKYSRIEWELTALSPVDYKGAVAIDGTSVSVPIGSATAALMIASAGGSNPLTPAAANIIGTFDGAPIASGTFTISSTDGTLVANSTNGEAYRAALATSGEHEITIKFTGGGDSRKYVFKINNH
ncbi:MAG: hypothetical protein LBN08_00140 [Lactobacillales bacterium]|jgi:hypothetical protein|nr:hypothetical protein [Lactobacillales bacterium]